MSTPYEELPSSPETDQAETPRRNRGTSDGSEPSAIVVASATDAPAPPRRRGPGAASGAVTAAAASAAATPLSGESTAALAPPDRSRPAKRSRRAKAAASTATPTTGDDATPDAAEDAPSSPSSTRQTSSTPAAPTPPRRAKGGLTDLTATSAGSLAAPATSEADAEAELIDDTEAPPRRRFGRPGRTVSASVPATPVVASAPVTVVPATPITGPTTSLGRSDRQYRQTVTKVDLWSVTKLSLCFYLSAMFVTVVAFVALWVIADAAGIIHSVEKFLGDLLSAKNFHFLSATVLRGAILIGLVVVALQVVITVIAASFYNIFAELFGGIEITVKEEGRAEYLDPSLGL